jgi:hypothetical protein
MAVGLYRFQCVCERDSPVSEDVAVIDLAFYFAEPGFDAAGFAALNLVNDTDSFSATATSAQADDAFDAFEDFLTTLASLMGAHHVWSKIVLVREDAAHPVPNTPVRDRVISIGGTQASNLPPQSALDVTLQTYPRRRWGRFYIPGITPDLMTDRGRAQDSLCDVALGGYQTLAGAMAGMNWFPIVIQAGSPAAGIARTVHAARCDNVMDVIRRRRWDSATYRASFTIA